MQRQTLNIAPMASLFTIHSEIRYEIVRKIYEGGMGIIYEAEQHGARNFVKRLAIKVIRQSYASQKQFIENFIGEAKLVADLIHTNIVQTYHLGESKGIYYIAMELIRGVNLEQFADQMRDKNRILPVDVAVFITSRVCRGLAYAHAKCDKDGNLLGLVHRDVSFKNIMVAFEGDVKLTDFGIACARGFLPADNPDVIVGSPDFMSPEQISGEAIDHRSDIFSTGVVLSTLLLNVNPFAGASVEEMRQHLTQRALPDFRRMNPEIDEDLDRILRTALARQAAHRYASAYDMLSDVEHYLYAREHGPTADRLRRFLVEITTTPSKTRNITRTRTKVIPKPTAKPAAKTPSSAPSHGKKRG